MKKNQSDSTDYFKLILLIAFAIIIGKIVLIIWNASKNPGKAGAGAAAWVEKQLAEMISACKPSCKDADGKNVCNGLPPVLNPTCLLGLAIFDYLLGFLGLSILKILRIIPAFAKWLSNIGWINESVEWMKSKFSITNKEITDKVQKATDDIMDLSKEDIKSNKEKVQDFLLKQSQESDTQDRRDAAKAEYDRISKLTPEEFQRETAQRAGINSVYNQATTLNKQSPTVGQQIKIAETANNSLSRVTKIELSTDPREIELVELRRRLTEESTEDVFSSYFEERDPLSG
jgi:hypothetical protein